MLTIIYIYFNFTIINIILLIVQTAHFAKTRHVDEMYRCKKRFLRFLFLSRFYVF